MQLIIVSGQSGSGKSIALETLEDSNYYCIDNLPIELFEDFIRKAVETDQPAYRKVAISIDARSRSEGLDQFPKTLDLAEKLGIECQVLFLKSELETLLKRFSETRRKHPLTDSSHPLMEAIQLESQLLKPIVSRAHLVIDTTHINVHQLRGLIRKRIDARKEKKMSLYCLSFGYKNGIPYDADFTFDARCLPNPHWEPSLRNKTGKDAEVREFLEAIPEVQEYLADLVHFVERWAPRFAAENRNYLTVAVGCTGGQHRSVFLVEALSKHLESEIYDLLIRHRDLN